MKNKVFYIQVRTERQCREITEDLCSAYDKDLGWVDEDYQAMVGGKIYFSNYSSFIDAILDYEIIPSMYDDATECEDVDLSEVFNPSDDVPFDYNGAITKLEIKIGKLERALHESINRPMGTVPDSAMEFYNPEVYTGE